MKSEKQKKQTILFTMKLLLLLVITCLYGVVWYLFYASKLHNPFYFYGDLVVIFIFMVLYANFSKLYGVYELKVSRTSDLVYSHAVALIVVSALMYGITILLVRRLPNVLPLLLFAGVSFIIGIPWCITVNRMTNRVLDVQNILLIYDNEDARRNGEYILTNIPWRYRMQDQIKIHEDINETINDIKEYKPYGVMLCGIHSTPRNTILKYCIMEDIPVYIRPNIGDFIVNSAEEIQLANLPVMLCERATVPTPYRFSKRAFDIALSLLGLIVFSPFMIVSAIVIKLYDGGPILYKQVRLTKNGKKFNVYKFRSMKVDAEKDGIARLASKNDDRITPYGKFIRAVRIDEIPQIFCILKGDMSIVGPRPERPEIARKYEEEMPEFALRLQVRAGLTGYAQVYGKYNTEPYDKLQMDLMYIAHQSFVTDLKIILATIKILFIPESTEGVAAGKTTALEKTDVEEQNDTDMIKNGGESGA